MLKSISIKKLYTPALAEGEGVGTAYEYYAKRLVLAPWLKTLSVKPKTILIAGLPEKYGSSLDFFLLADELGATVTVVDERPFALEKAKAAIAALADEGWPLQSEPAFQNVTDLATLTAENGRYDLILCSKVLQRLAAEQRQAFVDSCCHAGTAVALFAPNADNAAHTNISGLSGITLNDLQTLISSVPLHTPASNLSNGHIDMPPFPPGIVRSEEQREQATSGTFEAIAMWGLNYYARFEKWLPKSIRQRQSHIVYALFQMAGAPSP